MVSDSFRQGITIDRSMFDGWGSGTKAPVKVGTASSKPEAILL
jgi:hypothetical protein